MDYSSDALAKEIESKLQRHFRRNAKTASKTQFFKAVAMVIRDKISAANDADNQTLPMREVHYFSMEFLVGRSLEKNAYNLGMLPALEAALQKLGRNKNELFETEPDAGLGNGGLGRLAACYLEAMTTLDIPADGQCIRYEYGFFRQKIYDGEQVALPDPWELGYEWLIPQEDEVQIVSFEGRVETVNNEDGSLTCETVDDIKLLAFPYDMLIAGYGTKHVNNLRLWQARASELTDAAYMSGDYMQEKEQAEIAAAINKVLYPADNHPDGKRLRLRQQYFFVSAAAQNIVAKHKQRWGTLENFHEHHVIQINDTHPTLVIPELMRLFIDQEHMEWDDAWSIVTQTVAYTNHTVLAEALECWSQHFIQELLPRIWQILCEINDRYVEALWQEFKDEARVSNCAIIWDGVVRMANLCVHAGTAVNGVSALHSEILKADVFKNQYSLWPEKFTNVTNGVDHRRWLAQINPALHGFITKAAGGDKYLTQAGELEKLLKLQKDKSALAELGKIKQANKEHFCKWVKETQGIVINPNSLFDCQVKRLHEYKRQLLNVMHIIHLINQLQDNPKLDIVPRTFIFGAKAAPSYEVAKRIIRLICSVGRHIEEDPRLREKLAVVFLENYRVSVAEQLMPASELSEQISTAGKEASGTGNMKFMMNGALTIGTMDGANVEIHDLVGDDNVFIFGLSAEEVERTKAEGYDPYGIYNKNNDIRRVLDQIRDGFSDGVPYGDIYESLLRGGKYGSVPDNYLLLADFDSYCAAQARVSKTYADPTEWNRMSLVNIAKSGFFAADRSIQTYAENIWKV